VTTRVAVVILVLGLPLTAAAQRITITPQVGGYVPLLNQGESIGDPCDFRPCGIQRVRIGFDEGPALGLRMAFEWDDRIGFEASVVTAASQRVTIYSAIPIGSEPGTMSKTPVLHTTSSLRITFSHRLDPQRDVVFGLGIAVIALNTEDDWLDERSFLGPTLGVGYRIALTRRTRVELGLWSVLYNLTFDGGRSSRLQLDAVLTAGVGFAVRP
jgi:hypothetical protein